MKFIDDFVAYHKDFTGCPETFVRWSGLYALSAVAGPGHVYKTGNWNVTPSLWILLAGDSSTKKSTALSTVKSMISEIDHDMVAAQQYSEAALIDELSENSHRVFFYDEAESYFKMLSENYNQGMRSTMMTLFGGLSVKRKIRGKEGKGETKEVLSPYICWAGASTPYQISAHLSGSTTDLMSGFFPRILLVPQIEKSVSIPLPPPHSYEKYSALLARLRYLRENRVREYHYSEEAITTFNGWYERITKRAEECDSILTAFFLKMRDIYIHKIAIISAFERESCVMEEEDIVNSISLLYQIESGWQDLISKFTEKEWDRESRRIMEFIKERGKVTRSDVLKAIRGVRAQKLTAILEGLSQDQLIKISHNGLEDKPTTIIKWVG